MFAAKQNIETWHQTVLAEIAITLEEAIVDDSNLIAETRIALKQLRKIRQVSRFLIPNARDTDSS